MRCAASGALRARFHALPFSTLPPRVQAQIEDVVESHVRGLQFPAVGGSLGDARVVRSTTATDAAVRVRLALPSPAAPSVPALTRLVRESTAAALSAANLPPLPVEVSLAPWTHASARLSKVGPGLGGVGSIIAVASGKGGVGKSTVAVNLAFALASRGARVGLLDADVYGPSLPTMVRRGAGEGDIVKGADGLLRPVEGPLGVRCMSYGWVAKRNASGERGGAFMRGPMVSSVVSQLARFTAWGALDHLIIDCPPGTGDVHISLGQLLPMTGAVHVCTPQALALSDVAKGVDMFAALSVPPLAVVLNMAWFAPEGVHPPVTYYPFGDSTASMDALLMRCALAPSALFALPILPSLSASGDGGTPEVVAHPGGPAAGVYDALAAHVASGVEAAFFKNAERGAEESAGAPTFTSSSSAGTTVAFVPARGVVVRSVSADGAREAVWTPVRLRRACKCAGCVDESTGAARLKPESVREDVRPVGIEAMGNYGVRVTWSDGHASSIYTHTQLLSE
jgi:Mrp family chromosome partitioning ATPase